MQIKSYLKWITTGAACLTIGECTPTFINHGYIPPQEDLDAVIVGVATRASVEETVGPPSSGGVLNDSGYYYVRSRKRTFGPSAPKEI